MTENQSSISLEALHALDAIDRRGSYAAAAEELKKVPSALSYIIQKLEEQVGVTVFQRQGRRSVLTPAGKHLLKEGRHLLQALRHLEEQTRAIDSGWEPRIRIAFDSMFHAEKGFAIIEQFLRTYPTIEIDVREEVMNGGWEALINDDIDLLLGGAGPVPQHKGIHATVIAHFSRVFAVSPNHPITQLPQPVSVDALRTYRTVVVHDSAKHSIAWTKGIISDSEHFYVPTVDYKIQAQLAGVGCGFLPRQRVQTYLDSGQLVEIDLKDLQPRDDLDTFMAWKIANKGQGLRALRELFIANRSLLQTENESA